MSLTVLHVTLARHVQTYSYVTFYSFVLSKETLKGLTPQYNGYYVIMIKTMVYETKSSIVKTLTASKSRWCVSYQASLMH